MKTLNLRKKKKRKRNYRNDGPIYIFVENKVS